MKYNKESVSVNMNKYFDFTKLNVQKGILYTSSQLQRHRIATFSHVVRKQG